MARLSAGDGGGDGSGGTGDAGGGGDSGGRTQRVRNAVEEFSRRIREMRRPASEATGGALIEGEEDRAASSREQDLQAAREAKQAQDEQRTAQATAESGDTPRRRAVERTPAEAERVDRGPTDRELRRREADTPAPETPSSADLRDSVTIDEAVAQANRNLASISEAAEEPTGPTDRELRRREASGGDDLTPGEQRRRRFLRDHGDDGGGDDDGPPVPGAGPPTQDQGAEVLTGARGNAPPGNVTVRWGNETFRGGSQLVAEELEQEFLERNPGFNAEDVRIVYKGGAVRFQLTRSGRERFAEQVRGAELDFSERLDLAGAGANRELSGLRGSAGGRTGPQVDALQDLDVAVAEANRNLARARENTVEEVIRQLEQTFERDVSSVLTEAAGAAGIDTQVRFDVPGEGPLLTSVGERRDLGQVDLQVRAGPEDEFTTFEEVLADIEERILEATELQAPAVETLEPRRGAAGAALRTERAHGESRGPGSQPVRQFSQSFLRAIPLFVTGAVGLAKDAGEFAHATTGAAITGDFERVDQLLSNLGGAATEQAVLTAATAADDPGEFTARGLGTIAASAPLFGAARAVGPRTSLATRAAIQPGEEIAGIGGHAITRRLAGARTAQRLFPDQEPLIFSEEAAIRGLRRAGGKAAEAAERAEDLLRRTRVRSRPGVGLGGLKFEVEGESELESDIEEALREVERAAMNRRAEAAAEKRILDEALERGREARKGTVETESKTVDTRPSVSFERDPVETAVSQAGRLRRQRARMGPTEQQLRAFRADTETEARERLEAAQASSIDVESEVERAEEDLASELDRRAETAVLEEAVLTEAQARSIAEEVLQGRAAEDARPGQLDAELEGELLQELDLEGEAESEVEAEAERELLREIEGELESLLEDEQEEDEDEAEAERELLREIEGELESLLEDEQEEDEDEFEDLFGIGQKRFSSGIADVEDLEKGLLEAFKGGEDDSLLEDFKDLERDLADELDSFEDIERDLLEG